ncbi:helix-turn-helix domain-containing protein [Clostridium folliculivorans]|uniref:Transcriptional regulator n=1 Tax=Clostridium folliculivorans TaxID=2886038 RepID=A0A9W6D9S0_9CLOT|nr:helix-turn-helix transcriptional regulator [Clostridium folliculivorans]GKU24196.1 transcriptional regulator [Clostridium folliculivorans]GKU30301.1 transcriptional regulator [Clostridium folliculivorans]
MRIGEVIRIHRKKENLTQEQIANYLNISAPAVNKWENGISYPDITLLPPLARILKIDVNTLLAFNEELTVAEVNKFGREVGDMVSKEGYQKAFEKGNDLIKQYPSCDDLILRIASILRLFLVSRQIDDKDKYEEKIIAWIELIVSSSNEKIAAMAKISLSAIYREKKQFEKAQEMLDKIPELEIDTDKKIQQILLLESSGKFEDAYDGCERILFSNAHEAMAALSLMIKMSLKENKFIEAEEYAERAKKLIEAFDLGAYRKYELDLYLAKEKQDKEKAVEMIINMVNEAESMSVMDSQLYKHRKWKGNNSWNKDKYVSLVKSSIRKDKTLDFVKDDPRIKCLIE